MNQPVGMAFSPGEMGRDQDPVGAADGENRLCRGETPRNPGGEGRVMAVYCDDWHYVEMDTPSDG